MKNLKMSAAVAALVLLLAACGSDDETTTTDDVSESTTTSSTLADDDTSDDDSSTADDDDAEGAMSEDDDSGNGSDAPVGVAGQTGELSIVSIDFDSASVELINNTDAAIDINGWTMCNFPTYAPISGVDPIGPGETVTVTSTVALPPTDGELAIYTAEDFTDAEAIVTYVEWGSDGHTRSEVAIEAGIWDGTALTPDGSTLSVGG